jgi:predicted TIM-barrel fold metal-dependent hydrolase
MDSEGIYGNVIYPTTGLMFGSVDDLDLLVALCQAYNNWAKDFCSAAPDRLFVPAVVPQLDVFETLKETERAVTELGLMGIMMRPNPIGRTVEDPAWEPLWSLLEELDRPIGFHEGTALNITHLGADRTDNYLCQHVMSHPFEHMAALLALIAAGVLDRHPNLRVLFLEAGCGWVPYWLERIDQHLAGMWAYQDVHLSLSATDFFKRQCFVSADAEEEAVVAAFISCIGDDNLCWTTDFPHPDHDWRGMAKEFASREDISEDAKRKIMGGNISRAYKLSPEN